MSIEMSKGCNPASLLFLQLLHAKIEIFWEVLLHGISEFHGQMCCKTGATLNQSPNQSFPYKELHNLHDSGVKWVSNFRKSLLFWAVEVVDSDNGSSWFSCCDSVSAQPQNGEWRIPTWKQGAFLCFCFYHFKKYDAEVQTLVILSSCGLSAETFFWKHLKT